MHVLKEIGSLSCLYCRAHIGMDADDLEMRLIKHTALITAQVNEEQLVIRTRMFGIPAGNRNFVAIHQSYLPVSVDMNFAFRPEFQDIGYKTFEILTNGEENVVLFGITFRRCTAEQEHVEFGHATNVVICAPRLVTRMN